MTGKTPRISIGMPVFNGEKYIRQALDSLLSQDFEDFELIISDNASGDGTQEICLGYAARDRRIRYHRNNNNIGLHPNFNRVFELSTSPYFTWASSDDMRDPTFLSTCINVLEREPSVVLCYTEVILIDADGKQIGIADDDHLQFRSSDPIERFRQCIWSFKWGTPVHGLIRSSALKRTQLIGGFVSGDTVLLIELSLQGEFHQVAKPLFLRRIHASQASKDVVHRKQPWVLDPANQRRINLRWCGVWYQTTKVVKRAPLSYVLKCKLMYEVFRCFKSRYGSRMKAELRWELKTELKRIAKVWLLRRSLNTN